MYKNGYNTLPNLKKLSPSEVFEINHSNSEDLQVEKKEALASQNYFVEKDNDPLFYEVVGAFALRQYLIEEKDIDKNKLAEVIKNMNPEQKKYKGLEESESLIQYLTL